MVKQDTIHWPQDSTRLIKLTRHRQSLRCVS